MTANAGAPLEIAGVDIADGLKRLRGNEKLYRKLLGVLISNAGDEVAFFAATFTEAQRDDIRGHAHKLKGAAANLSATAVQKSAENLEGLARDAAAPFSAVVEAIPAYVSTCNDFINAATAAGI